MLIARVVLQLLRRGSVAVLGAALLLPFLTVAPNADAQVSFNVQIGTPPPVCRYGYYDYAPYPCAPVGYYGPGYFYNGIFVGVGPWAYWGYHHGWGPHRFIAPGGGRYSYYPDHRIYHDRDYYRRRRYDRNEHYYQDHDHGEHRGNAYGHYKHDPRGRGDHDHGDHGHGDH